jgi:hypothetical protein
MEIGAVMSHCCHFIVFIHCCVDDGNFPGFAFDLNKMAEQRSANGGSSQRRAVTFQWADSVLCCALVTRELDCASVA